MSALAVADRPTLGPTMRDSPKPARVEVHHPAPVRTATCVPVASVCGFLPRLDE